MINKLIAVTAEMSTSSSHNPMPASYGPYRKDLQPTDLGDTARAYRTEFGYVLDTLRNRLAETDEETRRKLRAMTGSKRLRQLRLGLRPKDEETKVELAIFECEVLLLADLFTRDNDHNDRIEWVNKERLLLMRLAKKLARNWRRNDAEKGFLNALKEDEENPEMGGHEEWLMDLVVTVFAVAEEL